MKIAISILMLFIVNVLQAQTEIEEHIGLFTPEEINYTECPFDKDAEAVVFFDKAVTNYDNDWYMVTNNAVRLKVLKEKGIDRANVRIRYYSYDDFENVWDIEGVVLSFDAQNRRVVSKLDKKDIFRTKLNQYYSEVTFALPNVRKGSLLEYRYTSVKKNYGGLRNWVFQWDIPVLESYYNLYVMPNHEFAYSIKKSNFLPIEVKSAPGNVSFSMKNIPGLRNEAFIGSRNDYLQRVEFQLAGFKNVFGDRQTTTTWKQFANELMDQEEFGTQLKKEVPNTAELNGLCDHAATPFEKMKTVYDYVRFGLTWDNVYSLYSLDGIKKCWEKKRGNTGDINLLLVNLLRSKGLEAYPVLVSERDHGKVDTTFPFQQQFNKVAACVLIDGKYYFLDGTDQHTPASLTPFQFLNTKAFIVDRKKSGLISITDAGKQKQTMVNVLANISTDGTITAETNVYSRDYARLDKLQSCGREVKKYKEEYTGTFKNIKIDSFKVFGLDSENLALRENFKATTSLDKSGSYYLLNYNLFSGYNKNPFIADHRFSNVDFGCIYSTLLNESFELPDNFTVESMPKNSVLKMPDNSLVISRIMEKQDNAIRMRVKIDINRTEFAAAEYEDLQEFYKRMLDYLNEPIVLKTK